MSKLQKSSGRLRGREETKGGRLAVLTYRIVELPDESQENGPKEGKLCDIGTSLY